MSTTIISISVNPSCDGDLLDANLAAVIDLHRAAREVPAIVHRKAMASKRGQYSVSKGQLMKTLFSYVAAFTIASSLSGRSRQDPAVRFAGRAFLLDQDESARVIPANVPRVAFDQFYLGSAVTRLAKGFCRLRNGKTRLPVGGRGVGPLGGHRYIRVRVRPHQG
ncbi:MAG: hypothetical protein ACJ8GN_29935 [Longimicrobiaceae bacterium]